MEPSSAPDPSDGGTSAAADRGSAPAGSLDANAIEEIEHYELDGIPLFHLPMAGSTILTIAFRVGRADEPVTHGGMTHLAEHLVLRSVTDAMDHSNGTTEPFRVTFTLRGSPADASRFLRDVCKAIERPMFHRMHEEANVLRTEAVPRSGGMGTSLRLMWLRTGFQGIGTLAMDELFLRGLDLEDLRAWVRDHFVAGNAALWIAGEIPADLDIALPPGPRKPLPPFRTIAGLETPTILAGPIPGVGVAFEAERTAASASAFRTLERHLRRALRIDRGLGYDVGADYMPVSVDRALVSVWATCLPKAVSDVERIMLETIDDIAARGPTDEELGHDYERMQRDALDPVTFPARLESRLRDELYGRPAQPMTDALDEQFRLQSDEVAVAFRTVRESMIMLVPPGSDRPQRPLRPYPGPARVSMGDGHVFGLAVAKKGMPWTKAATPTLAVAQLGVAIDDIRGNRLVGIRWDECVAVVHDPGTRTLLARDGWTVTVSESEWRDGRGAIQLIDRLAPLHLVVPLAK